MRRITINIDDNITDLDAVHAVMIVVNGGRISKDKTCYCYLTTLRGGVSVAAGLTKAGNDIFTVIEKK
ncbi:MAG: hypothetical protein V1755_14115 [Chloroflexota bacterium]